MITINFNPVYFEENIALGNHMFQYCVCRLVAEKNGYNFYIPYGQYLSKCFSNLELGKNDGGIKNYYNEENTQKFNQNIFSISDFTNLNGYYQTDKYFIQNENDVKSWFKVEIDNSTIKIIEKYPIEKFCYIHLRGGDYKLAGHSLLPKKYFVEAIEIVKNKFPDLSFVVITDDISLSKSYFPDLDVISNDVVTDFKSLYFSKYSIISNSSFSWWSSWLSDKIITIAPDNWLNYNAKHLGCHPIDIKTSKFIYI
jgi:hypothetical protein